MKRAAWLLLSLATVLLGAFAFDTGDGAPPPPTSASTAATALPPHPAQAPEDGSRVAVIMARPLFSPTRRPALADTTTPQAGPSAPAATAPPRLAGIIVSATSRAAIFVRGDDGGSLVLSEGGHIGEETVLRIEPGVVTLEGPGGRRAVRTSIDTALPPVQPPAPPSPPLSIRPGEPSPAAGVRPGPARRTQPLPPAQE